TTGRSGYIKAAYEPNPSYKVDVRKTDSLVSPYVGFLLLDWDKQYSDCEATQERASSQRNLPHFGYIRYRYTYAFQDRQWIATEHELRGSDGPWETCEEEKAHLAGSGYGLDY